MLHHGGREMNQIELIRARRERFLFGKQISRGGFSIQVLPHLCFRRLLIEPMSVTVLQPCSALAPRKRTSSFSFPCPAYNPRPAKAPRTMGALRRTESCMSLSEASTSSQTTTTTTAPKADTPTVPYNRSLQYQKDQRNARRKQAAALDNLTAPPQRAISGATQHKTMPLRQGAAPQQVAAKSPRLTTVTPVSPRSSRSRTPVQLAQYKRSTPTPPAQVILPTATSKHAVAIFTTQRTSSPLSPIRSVLPGRPIFPRSKTEPDLYKKALISRMKQTDQGKRILCMGPRLAISIWTATKELERIVEDQQRRDRDFDMSVDDLPSSPFVNDNCSSPAPPVLTNSWVVVRQNEDWEMVDCAS